MCVTKRANHSSLCYDTCVDFRIEGIIYVYKRSVYYKCVWILKRQRDQSLLEYTHSARDLLVLLAIR